MSKALLAEHRQRGGDGQHHLEVGEQDFYVDLLFYHAGYAASWPST